jgi:hypothetical protein
MSENLPGFDEELGMCWCCGHDRILTVHEASISHGGLEAVLGLNQELTVLDVRVP